MTSRCVVGMKIKTKSDSSSLGEVTDQYVEGENIWIVIDGNYEDRLINYEEIIDLVYGGNYLRHKSVRV